MHLWDERLHVIGSVDFLGAILFRLKLNNKTYHKLKTHTQTNARILTIFMQIAVFQCKTFHQYEPMLNENR